MKRIFMAAAIMVAGVFAGNAQSLSYKVEAGANFSDFDTKVLGSTKDVSKIIVGYRAGVGMEVNLSDNLYFSPYLMFKMNGAKADGKVEIAGSKTLDFKTTLHYLAMPLNLGFRSGITDNLAVAVEFGPYVAYGLKGTHSIAGIDFDAFKSDKKAELFEGGVKRFDWGLNGAVALEYTNFYFKLGADYGLYNIMKEGNKDNSFKNIAFYTNVGYRF